MDSGNNSQPPRPQRGHRAPPCAMVIFGASGDLTKRLLMPALYNLVRARRLSEQFAIIGIDRSKWSEADFRAHLGEGVRTFVSDTAVGSINEAFDADTWEFLASRMTHLDGDATNPDLFLALDEKLKQVEAEYQTGGNVLFYLAVAGSLFGTIIERLGEAGLTNEENGRWRRVIIEKPFGHDLPSARELDARLLKTVGEQQIYRMDHFLG